jgi:hypothetical protein
VNCTAKDPAGNSTRAASPSRSRARRPSSATWSRS